MRVKSFLGVAAALAMGARLASAPQDYAKNIPADHPAIQYAGEVHDRLARLSAELEAGSAKLDFRPDFGYLPALLDKLGINSDSQALVFSKTGLQGAKTSPRSPRAIYFADDVAVGFVRGADKMELVASDPRQGATFYTMDMAKSDSPKLRRQTMCLQCHQGPATAGIPGMYVGSVFPSVSGTANFREGAIVTDQRTKFEDRWGGWYITGTHGAQKHRGNAVALDPSHPFVLETEGTQNLTSLATRFDTSKYLLPTSDIVALMTFEHQTQMTNLMIRAGWEFRTGDAKEEETVDDLVSYMLFTDETPMSEPIAGVSTFTRTFPQRGPRDSQGRSLRDFDLKTRLFRYPLSYMIYSPVFDAMPEEVRAQVGRRLLEELPGKGKEGQAVLEILRETKPLIGR